jgi:hypothetical protein
MRTAALRALTAWLLSVLILSPALAQERDERRDEDKAKKEAKRLLFQGDAAFAKKDYKAALQKYQQAYEAYDSPKIFYPMAQTEEKPRLPVGQLDELDPHARREAVLGAHPGDPPPQGAVLAVEEELALHVGPRLERDRGGHEHPRLAHVLTLRRDARDADRKGERHPSDPALRLLTHVSTVRVSPHGSNKST